MSALPDDVFVLPASLAQKRYWHLDQLVPGNPAHNMPLAFRLEGPLDVPALERALSSLAARHEILRASFDRVGDNVMQIVRPEASVDLEMIDLAALPPAERDRRTDVLVLEEARRPFVLARGTLFRTTLLRRSALEHVLLVTMHHSVCDGWSNGILVREVGELYRAAVEGDAPRMPELPIQFADFANWQQEWLRGEKFEEAFDYWRGRLAGSLPVLEVPTDRPRRPGVAAPGVIETLLLDKPLSDALRSFGRQVDATPFMLFFTAFVALLSRWSGQEDVLVSSPAANRQHVETEGLIGPFANPLLLRVDVSGPPTLRALVLRVRDLALAAFSFAELPFEKLVEWQETTLRQVPYVPRVMFIYQTAFMQPVALPNGLILAPLRSVSPGSAFDLMQSVVERAEGQRLQLEYNPDLFDASTIERFLKDYGVLLRAIGSTPDAPLLDVPLALSSPNAFENVPGKRPESSVSERVGPRDDVERKLVGIWEDVLGTSPIGIHENYFELGGHSLLAVKLFSRIESSFGTRLPISALLDAPTVSELAVALGSSAEKAASEEMNRLLREVEGLPEEPPAPGREERR